MSDPILPQSNIVAEGDTPTSIPLTESQQKRMTEIERAIEILHAAEAPYMVVASPDAINAGMRFAHSAQLAFGRELAGTAGLMGICRTKMLDIALRKLTIGLRGGLVVVDHEGKPLTMYQNGEQTHSLKTSGGAEAKTAKG